MCAAWNLKTWNLSLGGRWGTHGAVMQRRLHVYVTCANRPMLSRRIVGFLVDTYGVKLASTRRRSGSTHFVSATMAILAVTESPKRWTVGVIVAYALMGVPSPSDEPDWNTGRLAAAGAASARADTATRRTRFTPRLRATSGAGRPSAGMPPATRRSRGCARGRARRRASGSRARAPRSVPRARHEDAAPRASSGRPERPARSAG